MATCLNDSKLIANMAQADIRAVDSVYHNRCLVNLRNRMRRSKSGETSEAQNIHNFDEKEHDDTAFSNVLNFLKLEREKGNCAPIALTDLHKMYTTKLQAIL